MDDWLVRGDDLRALREEAELKPPEMAKLIGCHPQHLRKLEAGAAQPSPELCHAILRVLRDRLDREVVINDFAKTSPAWHRPRGAKRKSAA